jgi:Protein of unknown function (DUF3311)
MKWLLTLVVIAVVLLHQDFWLWNDKRLVFGFVPIGLAYQIGYSFLAALTMWVLVRFAWPAELDAVDAETEGAGA